MHVLTVRASGDGRVATERLVVRVVNRDFALTTSALHPWQKVKGVVRIRASVRGARTNGIALYVDGRAVSRDRSAPYTLRWNSRKLRDGRHWIALAAIAADGRVAKRRLPLVVANHVRTKPKPKPVPRAAPQVTAQNLAEGQFVSGVVEWRAHTIGPVARVEFVVDGSVIATAAREPWATMWDSSTVAPGAHTLEVRAYTKDSRRGVARVTVTSSSG
jgi:hypothetical protein